MYVVLHEAISYTSSIVPVRIEKVKSLRIVFEISGKKIVVL